MSNRKKTSPAEIAREWNVWLRYQDEWYTPDEFEKWLSENPLGYKEHTADYLNPYRELRSKLNEISRRVTEKQDIAAINEAMQEVVLFTEKIKSSGYDPKIETGKEKMWEDWD